VARRAVIPIALLEAAPAAGVVRLRAYAHAPRTHVHHHTSPLVGLMYEAWRVLQDTGRVESERSKARENANPQQVVCWRVRDLVCARVG